jgi:hypothetical protein
MGNRSGSRSNEDRYVLNIIHVIRAISIYTYRYMFYAVPPCMCVLILDGRVSDLWHFHQALADAAVGVVSTLETQPEGGLGSQPSNTNTVD